jgi:hypothetical protein
MDAGSSPGPDRAHSFTVLDKTTCPGRDLTRPETTRNGPGRECATRGASVYTRLPGSIQDEIRIFAKTDAISKIAEIVRS